MKLYVVKISNGEYYNAGNWTVNKEQAEKLSYNESESIKYSYKRKYNMNCITECK